MNLPAISIGDNLNVTLWFCGRATIYGEKGIYYGNGGSIAASPGIYVGRNSTLTLRVAEEVYNGDYIAIKGGDGYSANTDAVGVGDKNKNYHTIPNGGGGAAAIGTGGGLGGDPSGNGTNAPSFEAKAVHLQIGKANFNIQGGKGGLAGQGDWAYTVHGRAEANPAFGRPRALSHCGGSGGGGGAGSAGTVSVGAQHEDWNSPESGTGGKSGRIDSAAKEILGAENGGNGLEAARSSYAAAGGTGGTAGSASGGGKGGIPGICKEHGAEASGGALGFKGQDGGRAGKAHEDFTNVTFYVSAEIHVNRDKYHIYFDGAPLEANTGKDADIYAHTDYVHTELEHPAAPQFSYRLKNSGASMTPGLPADAGTYELRVDYPKTVNAKGMTYEACFATCNVTIEPYSITDRDNVTVTCENWFVYDGNEHNANVKVKIDGNLVDPKNYDIVGTYKATEIGDYGFHVEGKNNLSGTTISRPAHWAILKAPKAQGIHIHTIGDNAIVDERGSRTVEYDGKWHSGYITVDYPSDAKIEYRYMDPVTGKYSWIENIHPGFVDAQRDNYIQYRINREGFTETTGYIEIDIDEKIIQMEIKDGNNTFPYDGKPHLPVIVPVAGSLCKKDPLPATDPNYDPSKAVQDKDVTATLFQTEGMIDVNTPEVPNYTVRVSGLTGKDAANYQTYSAYFDFTITPGVPEVITAPAAKDLSYTGDNQLLVTAGSAENGTILYSLEENGTYTADIPVGKDAKDYTVWYKIKGNQHYGDTAPAKVDVTIKQAEIDVSGWQWDYTDPIPYTGAAQRVQLKDQSTNRDINLVDVQYTDNSKTVVGEYTAQATAAAKDANHKVTGTIPNCLWQISRAPVSDAGVSITAPQVGDTPQSVCSGSGFGGSITWTGEMLNGQFDFNTVYTANVVLTPDGNHSFSADAAESSGLTGAVLNDDGTITGTKTFEATRKAKLQSITAPQDQTLNVYCAAEQDAVRALPMTAAITAEDGSTVLNLSWEAVGTYNPAVQQTNTFRWTAAPGSLDVNGQSLTGTITVTNIDARPVTHSGADREITYSGSTYDVSDLFTLDTNAGVATYEIVSGGTGEGELNGSVLTVRKAGSIHIKVTTAPSGEFASGTATAVLTVKKGQGAGSVTLDGWTYGESGKLPTPVSATNGISAVTYTYCVKGTDNFTVQIPANAGAYRVKAVFGATDLYESFTAEADFTISPCALTIQAKNQEITYAEQPLIQTGMDQVTVIGLKSGDTLTGVTLTANCDFTQVMASEAVITNGDSDAAGNYQITYKPGTLTRIHDWNPITYSWANTDKGWVCTAERTDRNNEAVKDTASASASGEVTKAPTCETMGDTTYTAVFKEIWALRQTKTVTDLAALGHSWNTTVYTWSDDGKICTAKRICKTDGTHIQEASADITGAQTKAPTCEHMGDTTYTAVFKEIWALRQTKTVTDLAALGHNWSDPVFTFSEDGKTAAAERICGNDSSHTMAVEGVTVTGEITTPAACSVMGTTTYTAKVSLNGTEYTQTTTRQDVAIDSSNHNSQIVKVEAKVPTCTESGVKEHYKCSGCGKLYSDADGLTEVTSEEVTIKATGHKWGEPIITFSEDGKTATAVVTCENDKTHAQKLNAKVTSQVKTPATKETMGVTTYRASAEFEGKTYTAEKDVQNIPKIKPAETLEKVESHKLETVPESLKDTQFNTVEKIEQAMEEVVLKKIAELKPAGEQKTTVFDASLMITENGVTRPATKEEVEARGGITIVIPYPAGTNRSDFVFTVAHMLTMDMAGMSAGDIEMPEITLTDTGLKVTLKGLSPVMVGYSKKEAPAEPTVPETTVPETTAPAKPDSPATGDSFQPVIWIGIMVLAAAGIAVVLVISIKNKKNKH